MLKMVTSSIAPILKNLHRFDIQATGLALLALSYDDSYWGHGKQPTDALSSCSIGACFGFATSLLQKRLYRLRAAHRGPEARLYTSCGAAFLFPVGMFVFAWCGVPRVSWLGLVSGMVLFMWGLFIMYTAVFSYLADTYGPYASAAIAGTSFARNLAATAFPLFITEMNDGLGYPWSNTVFAIIAVVLAPVPYVRELYSSA
jgi:hypothetical protein